MSSIRAVNRLQSALAHCGAVTLVGSWRMRDLYARPVEDEAESGKYKLNSKRCDGKKSEYPLR
jgi:hypothetical protein